MPRLLRRSVEILIHEAHHLSRYDVERGGLRGVLHHFATELINDVRKDGVRIPYEVPVKAAYRVYSRWCDDMNYHPDNFKNFRAAMEKTYEVKKKRPKEGGTGVSMIIGVRLREEESGAEDEGGEVFKPLTDEKVQM